MCGRVCPVVGPARTRDAHGCALDVAVLVCVHCLDPICSLSRLFPAVVGTNLWMDQPALDRRTDQRKPTLRAEGCIVGVFLDTRCVGLQYLRAQSGQQGDGRRNHPHSFLMSDPHGLPDRKSRHLRPSAAACTQRPMKAGALFPSPSPQRRASSRLSDVAVLFAAPGHPVSQPARTSEN